MYILPAVILSIYLLCVRYFFKIKNKVFVSLVAVYLVSCIAALFQNHQIFYSFKNSHDVNVVIVYSILICISIYPSSKIRRPDCFQLLENNKVFIVMILLIPLIWFSFIYHLPYVFKALSIPANILHEKRNYENYTIFPKNILTTIAIGVAWYYPLFILLYFTCIVKQYHFFVKASMFIGSVLYLLNCLTFAARDGVLWYIGIFLWIYWIYRPYLHSSSVKKLKVTFGSCSMVAFVFFSIFTKQRFSTKKFGLLDYIISYMGQQIFVFCETVSEQKIFYGLSLRFPLIANVLGQEQKIVRSAQYETMFGTFLKDFYAINGWSSLLIMVLIPTIILSSYFSKQKNIHTLSYLVLSTLYIQFMLQGVFYFRMGIWAGNVYIISMLLLSGIDIIRNNVQHKIKIQYL